MKLPFRGRREPTVLPSTDPDAQLRGGMFAVQTNLGHTTYIGFTRNGPEIEVRNQGGILGIFACIELLSWFQKSEPLTIVASKDVTLEVNPMTGMTFNCLGFKTYTLSKEEEDSLYQVLTGVEANSDPIQDNS